MKTRNFLLIIFVVFLATISCKTTQIAEEQPLQQENQQVLNPRPPDLIVWRASIHQNLNINEVIYFHNNYDILLKGAIPKYIDPIVEEGGFKRKDSVFYIERLIPAFTPGRVIDIKRDKDGTMLQMTVRFDLNDESFKIIYMMEDYARWQESLNQKRDPRVVLNPIVESGSFILKANAKIFYLGKEADVDARINSSDDDRLLVKMTGGVTKVNSKEVAKGMAGTSVATSPIPPSIQKGTNEKSSSGSKSSYTPTK